MALILRGSDNLDSADIVKDSTCESDIAPYNKGFKNYLINGNFDVWQRGTSFSSGGYTADRFIVFNFSGNVVKNGTPSGPQGFPNHLSVTKTAGQDTIIVQRWEMPTNKCKTFLNGRTLTFSAWILSSIPIDNVLFIKQGVAANSYEVKAFSITKSPTLNTWSKIEATISNINFAYEDGDYIEIRIDPVDNLAGTTHTTGWQLEEGSVATPFENRLYGLELSLCQRYFYYFDNYDALYRITPATKLTTIPFPVNMRTTPTILSYRLDIDGIPQTVNSGAFAVQITKEAVLFIVDGTYTFVDVMYFTASAEL